MNGRLWLLIAGLGLIGAVVYQLAVWEADRARLTAPVEESPEQRAQPDSLPADPGTGVRLERTVGGSDLAAVGWCGVEVLDAQGAPIQGVRVQFSATALPIDRTTDQAGRARVAWGSGVDGWVVVKRHGVRRPVVRNEYVTVTIDRLRLKQVVVIDGETHHRVPHAMVCASCPDDRDERVRRSSNAMGEVAFPVTEQGPNDDDGGWCLYAEKEGRRSDHVRVEAHSPDPITLRLLPAFIVTGQVVDEVGGAVTGARVSDAFPLADSATRTDGGGRFVLAAKQTASTVVLEVHAEGYATALPSLVVNDPDCTEGDLGVIHLTPGHRLAVTVEDEVGASLSGVDVWLNEMVDVPGVDWGRLHRTRETTDDGGVVIFEGCIPDARSRVRCSRDGYALEEVVVKPGRSEGLRIRMSRVCSLELNVVGERLPKACDILLYRGGDLREIALHMHLAQTSRVVDGTARFESLAPGPYTAEVLGAGLSRSQSVVEVGPGANVQSVAADPGRAVTGVVWYEGVPVKRARVSAMVPGTCINWTSETDNTGAFTLEGASEAHGMIRLCVDDLTASERRTSGDLEVYAGDHLRVELDDQGAGWSR